MVDEIRKVYDFWEMWFAVKISIGFSETRGVF